MGVVDHAEVEDLELGNDAALRHSLGEPADHLAAR